MLSGKALKIHRIQKDMKAKNLAAQLNISKSYLSILEHERQDIPLLLYRKWIRCLDIN